MLQSSGWRLVVIIALLISAGSGFSQNQLLEPTATSVSAGSGSSYAVFDDGSIMVWGDPRGWLRDADFDWTIPFPVFEVSDVEAISASDSHVLALLEDGSVTAWGSGNSGQLGDGSMEWSRDGPTTVVGIDNATAVSAGSQRSFAVLNDGTVVAWGYNDYGGLCDGTTDRQDTPVQVVGLRKVQDVSAGFGFFLALLDDGTVMACGRNDRGQLGNGTYEDRTVPEPVDGLRNVVAISAGDDHSLALLEDGSVMAWGSGNHGQLGDGSTAWNKNLPILVDGLDNVRDVAAGDGRSFALLANGEVRAWGWNASATLGVGDDTTEDSLIPVPVPGINDAQAIAAGSGHVVVVNEDGSAAAWGYNDSGQLGNGTTDLSGRPVEVVAFATARRNAVEMLEAERQAAVQAEAERAAEAAEAGRAEAEREQLARRVASLVGEHASDMARPDFFPRRTGSIRGWTTALYTTNGRASDARVYVANVAEGQYCSWTVDLRSAYIYPNHGYQTAEFPGEVLPSFNFKANGVIDVALVANPYTGDCERW